MSNQKRITKILFAVGIVLLFTSCNYKRKLTATDISLAPEYGSNMVFRKNDSIILHGTCNSYGILGVSLLNGLKTIQADIKGNWRVAFPPIDYAGNFDITVEGIKQSIELKNLVCGKLYVVAGNAWLSEKNLFSADDKVSLTIKNNQQIRLFVPDFSFNHANAKFSGNWIHLSASNITNRTAFASIIGESIHDLEKETVGIICLTYPGTNVQNFSSKYRNIADSLYPDLLLDSIWSGRQEMVEENLLLADTAYNGLQRDVLNRYYDDWEWSETSMPLITDKRWYLKNRIVWLRKKIYISEKFINSDFKIHFGALRGKFDFYFNGERLKQFEGDSENLTLTVPDTLIKVWTNLLTLRMVCSDSLVGIYNNEPVIFNEDESFKKGIGDDWVIRTYYEPALSEIKYPKYLSPPVYSNFFNYFIAKQVDEIIIAGGIEQYIGGSEADHLEMLNTLEENFNAPHKRLFLINKASYIDSITNNYLFDEYRNQQLLVAADKNWKIVNTLCAEPNKNDLSLFYRELVDCYIAEQRYD